MKHFWGHVCYKCVKPCQLPNVWNQAHKEIFVPFDTVLSIQKATYNCIEILSQMVENDREQNGVKLSTGKEMLDQATFKQYNF